MPKPRTYQTEAIIIKRIVDGLLNILMMLPSRGNSSDNRTQRRYKLKF